MTPLEKKLRRQIELTGPLSVADYMAQCLFDPDHGYYTTREPFGTKGDFTTAPEISQMFGEIIAAWWVTAESAISLPNMHMVEIGPGRGTLMEDLLRTIGKLTGKRPPVHMIEASPRLSEIQRRMLSKYGADIVWHLQVSDLPPMPAGIIANELFDALPIRQFQKTENGWLERMVQLDGKGKLTFALSLNQLDSQRLSATHDQAARGAIFEYAPARETFMEVIAQHLMVNGGFALFIDYGHANSGFGDTLQAVREHNYVSVFDRPGESDLTSHVDFEALTVIAQACGLCVTDTLTQGDFLTGAGIAQRSAQLAAKARPEAVNSIKSALARLTGSRQMGQLFKVKAVSSQPFDAHPLKFRH